MSLSIEMLEAEARLLSPEERIALAQRLLSDLEGGEDIDPAWVREIERRIAEVENGSAKLIPFEEGIAQVRSILK